MYAEASYMRYKN